MKLSTLDSWIDDAFRERLPDFKFVCNINERRGRSSNASYIRYARKRAKYMYDVIHISRDISDDNGWAISVKLLLSLFTSNPHEIAGLARINNVPLDILKERIRFREDAIKFLAMLADWIDIDGNMLYEKMATEFSGDSIIEMAINYCDINNWKVSREEIVSHISPYAKEKVYETYPGGEPERYLETDLGINIETLAFNLIEYKSNPEPLQSQL